MQTTANGLAAGFPAADYQNINQVATLLYKVVPPYNRVWRLGSLKTVESLDDPTLVAHLDAHGLLVSHFRMILPVWLRCQPTLCALVSQLNITKTSKSDCRTDVAVVVVVLSDMGSQEICDHALEYALLEQKDEPFPIHIYSVGRIIIADLANAAPQLLCTMALGWRR